jgi:hypothetical protein
VRSQPGHTFEWELPVTNLGGRPAQQSRIEVLVPPSLSTSDIWISGGACTSGAGAISCELGDVVGGSSRSLHITLTGDTLGSNSVSARISSLADANPLNNTAEGTIVIANDTDSTSSQAPIPTAQIPSQAAGQTGSGGGGGAIGSLSCSHSHPLS